MLSASTAAALFATSASVNAEIVSLRTVRAGELGKFDLVIWKVKGQRNRFFLTVDGALSANSYLDLVILNPTPEEAEYYFARDYTNTIRAIEEQAQDIIAKGAKLQAIAEQRAAHALKYPGVYKSVGPVTVLLLAFFARHYGMTAGEAVAA